MPGFRLEGNFRGRAPSVARRGVVQWQNANDASGVTPGAAPPAGGRNRSSPGSLPCHHLHAGCEDTRGYFACLRNRIAREGIRVTPPSQWSTGMAQPSWPRLPHCGQGARGTVGKVPPGGEVQYATVVWRPPPNREGARGAHTVTPGHPPAYSGASLPRGSRRLRLWRM